MYTQCPDCQTRFRVTAEALRAARGTVRCGRCGGAFDALPRLSDSLPRARPEVPAVPIDFRSDAEFVPVTAVDLAPVIEAELARLDLAERRDFDAADFASIGEQAAESTAVLVDEGVAAETITLEGEEFKVEGAAAAEPEVPGHEAGPSAEPAADWPVAEEEEPPAEADIDAESDLDITDRYEILRIPPSAYPDPQEAEREFEALVQRLQREFDARAVPVETATGEVDEDTAETAGLDEESSFEQTATLEPEDREPAAEVPATEGPGPGEPAAELPTPDSAAVVQPAAAALDAVSALEVAVSTHARSAEVGAAASATISPAREAPIVVPVGERPLSARRWRSPPEELEEEAAPGRSAGGLIAWSLGSLLLALLLAAQVVHHYRQELARDARFGPTLRGAYERLGVTLPPSWDLGALELRQWGNDERGDGRMLVRASLTNRALFAQPLPILRLQFEDRYGVAIAGRDFEPAEYLQDAGRAGRPLAPAESAEAELEIADPGVEAVGYRLEVCLRESPTQIRCAPGPG